MKKFIFICCVFLKSTFLFAQTTIPYGTSLDSIVVYDGYYHAGPRIQSFHLYKPSTYDPATSPILFAMHGSGGNGTSAINDLDSIAERRKALVVSPNFPYSGFNTILSEGSATFYFNDTACCQSPTVGACIATRPATIVIKEIYRHVLARENRQSVPSYMIGFSAGGQFVNRYMLWRQVYPDSIPIKMAVSSNPYFYTFPTDTFLGVAMPWNCGLIPPDLPIPPYCANATNLFSFCNDHVIQYYNENYGVLIGTNDILQLNDAPCGMAQGNNRYERALNFYNFADSNAVTRGTTLQWQYVEIPGIGHDQHAMYNNKVSPTDTSTIAETLLFDTPYHNVPFTAPVASFYSDTTKIYLNGTVNFFNTSINATSYLWDFGDGNTSTLTNPSHTYSVIDTFIVQLTAFNGNGCSNWFERRNYIKVIIPTSVNEINENGFQIKIDPNPFTSEISITLQKQNIKQATISIKNILGQTVFLTPLSLGEGSGVRFDLSFLERGIYLVEVNADGERTVKKIIKE